MKLLILTDWFYPGYKAGGPIQSCYNLAILLRERFDIYVVCSDRDLNEQQPYPGIRSGEWNHELVRGIQIYYSPKLSMARLKQLIHKVQPDVVHLNHLYSPRYVIQPLWLVFTRQYPGKLVLSPRGALLPGALAVKSYKKYPFIFLLQLLRLERKILFHATTDDEAKSVKRFFPKATVEIVSNPLATQQDSLKLIEKVPGRLRLVYLARIHPIKNLYYLLSLLEQMAECLIMLDIIGPIDNYEYWGQCQRQIRQLPAGVEVHYWGALPQREALTVLEKCHLSVLPSEGENFGHSIFESFLVGRPVLISDTTPWRRLVMKKIGWDIGLNDNALWMNAIRSALSWDQALMNEYAENSWQFARLLIENNDFKENYTQLFS